MADVELKSVRKVYPNGFEAIHGLDLDIGHGEFVVLVGPSGCGKSTLLRMVAGLERISAGDIVIGGRCVNDVEPADRDIAMVFQNYALYPHMSCYDNMAYGLRNRRTPKPEIERRVREASRVLDIEGILDRKPRQLSGGQRQRVAMGRAIVREPVAFLFDEPLSNLDAKLRVQMRLEIKKLQKRLATTALYVTHDQVEAMTMADRLVVMNEGIAEQVGTPLEVYRRPATRFVAGFIGSPAMNFFAGNPAQDGTLVTLGPGTSVALGHSGVSVYSTEVTIGIRPEHLRVDPEGTLSVGVELVESLGADTLLHGTFGTTDQPVTVRYVGECTHAAGDIVPLSVSPEDVHVFRRDGGGRLPDGN